VIAILLREPGFEAPDSAIVESETLRISAATLVEISIIVGSRGGEPVVTRLDRFLRLANVLIEPFTEEQAYLARQAYSVYGQGRHAAGLNFGDCFFVCVGKSDRRTAVIQG
jgi:ribonuclease VapC